MRFLVDNGISPRVAAELNADGHDAVHVAEYDMSKATDNAIFDRAMEEDRIVLSADTDFGTIIAMRNTRKPSVILLRLEFEVQHVPEQVALLRTNLPNLEYDLDDGCIVIFEPSRIRIRKLPIGR